MCNVGGHSGQLLMVTPKDLLVACCETNLRESHKISYNQAQTAPDPRPIPEWTSASFSSTTSYGISGDFNLGLFRIKSYRNLTEDPKSQTVRA